MSPIICLIIMQSTNYIIICNICRKHLVWRVPLFFFPKRNKSCRVLSTQASKLVWPGSGYFIHIIRNPCHCWLSHLLLGLPVSLSQQRGAERDHWLIVTSRTPKFNVLAKSKLMRWADWQRPYFFTMLFFS